jgi:hypothetical protein
MRVLIATCTALLFCPSWIWPFVVGTYCDAAEAVIGPVASAITIGRWLPEISRAVRAHRRAALRGPRAVNGYRSFSARACPT